MKKHLLLNQSFGTEGSPNQTDETQTRENRIGLISYLRRTLMLLFAVLTLSIANVGMAWGGVTVFTSVSQETTDGSWTLYGSSASASEQSSVVFPNPAAETGFPTGTQSKKNYYSKLSGTSDLGAKLTDAKCVKIAGLSAGDQIKVYWFATNTTATTLTLSYATSSSKGAKIEDKATASVTSKQVYSTTFTALSASDITNITSAYAGSAGYAYISSSNSVYIYAVKITAAGSGWGIAGTMNSWTAATNEMTGSGTVSTTISLSANTQYEFKVVDISSNTWYGNGGTIKGGITDWLFETSKGNTYLRTSCAGDYTFTFNTSTKNLSITYPNSNKVYFAKGGASWTNIYAYGYNDGDWNIGWPGVEITSNTEDNCGTEYYAYTNGYTYIIFNNGSGGDGNQTGNITVSGYEGKHAVGAAATGWEAYPTYTISYAANGGSSSMSSQTGIACGTDKATSSNTFTAPSGYQFAGWVANVDVTVGGSTKTAGTVLDNGVTIQNISSNITLTAQWELIPTYDVIYNTNGGTGGSTASQTGNLSGAQVTTRANGFTKTGYKFKWWNTKADGSGEDFYPGEKVTINGADVELFAQWETVAANEEFWVGNPTTWTSSKFSVGDMDVKTNSTSKATFITDLTSSNSKVNGSDKHAKVILVQDNNNYIQISFSDGSTINDLRLGITTTETSNKNAAVVYSTKEDFSTGEYETKTVSVPANNASAKSLTNFSPATSNKFKYVRIYRKVSTSVYSFTGGSGNNLRIYAIKAQKGSSCTAPSSVGISGEWRYFPGQTISLTATPTGHTGTPTYQWQKEISADNWQNISNGTEAGVTISGATTNILQITPCGTGNTGKYRCSVSTGATCSTTSDPFSVKIFTLNGAYDDGEFSSNNITWTSGTTGTATVHLAAGRVYKFKVTDNFGMWFGNSGRILEPAVNWTFPSNNDDNCVLFTGPEGDYTFTVDIDHVTYGTPEVVVSVAYPEVTHPSAGYAYFKNVDNWTNVALHMWYQGGGEYSAWASDPWVTKTTTICGATYYYTPLIPSWYNRAIFHEVSGSGQTGDITITNLATYSGKYNDKSDANWHDFTTYSITYAANGGGSSMSATSGICPDADLAITSNAFTAPTGCASFAHWTANVAVKVGGETVPTGNQIANGATIQDINSDITLTAVWKLAAPTITDNGDNTFSISGSMAGSSYYYTTDDGTPTTSSSLYSSAVDFSAGKDDITAKAIAHKDGYVDSDVASQACTYHAPAVGCIDANSTNFGAGNSSGDASKTLADGTVVAMNKCTNSASSVSIGGNILFTAPTGKAFETFSFVATCGSAGKTNYYKINGGSQQSLESSTTTAKTYTITIPGATNATTIQIIKNGTTPAVSSFCYTFKDICTAPTTAFANGSYTIGGSALDLSTLISSNNSSGAITYTVKKANGTGATIAGTSFTATSAGTATVTATQAANGGHCEKVMDATITVSAAATTYSVTHSLTNVTATSGATGAGAATEGVAYNAVFAANTGYVLPSTITVTIGGSPATVGTGYTWNASTGAFQVPAAQVTGDIVITIAGDEIEGDGCEELVNVEAATATTTTDNVGSSTVYNASGQTANSKSIKLNSSGYIELSPKAGKSFAAGDSLIIVMWNQASGAKTTGYRIAGTDYTASMPSKVNTTFRRKLIAADIVSSKVKIERESGNGSNAYFVSAIIKHCEDMASCTTPSLPTLSNQTVCPGSDIAAWNATQTAVLADGETASYSWKKKGNDTEIEDEATLDLGAATESMAGTYVVTVTVSKAGNASSSASKEVTLTVTPATETPSITASKAKVYATDEVTLTATCGSTGVTWNWYLCANSDGTGAGSSLGTSATYTIASAPAAGTYYYKAVATGDGTHSCGAAEYVYTLVVSADNSCDKEFWFAKEGDRPTGAASATHITGCPSGSSSASYTASVDGTNYTLTGSTGQKTGNVTIVVPADNTGTLYVVVQGSSSRTITLSKGGVQVGQETPGNSTWGVFTFDNLDAGTYTLVSSGNISWAMMALKLCPTAACTDDTPTAAATNATVCAGGTITITATGYEAGATFQWQKQNASTSVWENIDDATSDTYTVTTAAAEHAGNYHIVATKNCARTSNTVTIAVPSVPDFGSTVPASVSVMQTLALSINTVEATDAVKYKWYKSADPTWDAGDTEIGTNKELIKAYDGEAIGTPSYYIFCRAQNACGITTSTAIAVNVTEYVEEDCATKGNEDDAEFGFENTGCGSGNFPNTSTPCWNTNSKSKYLTYTAPDGKYFDNAKVTVAVSSDSKAAYGYSTDGSSYTYANLDGLSSALAEKTIDLPANVTHFRIGRNFDSGYGVTSGTFYLSKACFEYTDACTATTVTVSPTSKTYTIGNSWTAPTITLGPVAVASETLTYTSSDEDIATVDDDGTVNFQGRAGSVTITASYAGGEVGLTDYCASEGSYTITVSCSGDAPKIVEASTVDLSGCNSSVVLNAKEQDGTTDFTGGSYQWLRNGEEIDGATNKSYTATQAGIYTVEYTSAGGCTSVSTNSAVVTSETTEPEVERLVPFQYYHVNKTYSDQMKMRHLFAVKNSGTLDGKHFKMYVSRNGAAATDVTSSNALVVVPNGDGHVDTVMVDLNKLSGKYSENDELVFTCKAINCDGNVSEVYKNTITMNVIGATPTLALICSGSSKAGGTRKESELTVGGDFLTGYNKADLCEQTGKESFNANTEWGLYTRLKENYTVTPVNGYAVFNKLNYEPFDILLLTDYPKASKSDAAATVLDDMAALCDYRPMLSFKTHMVKKSPSKWAAKGFTTSPVVTKGDGKLNLNIVCYAHPMFASLKTGDDVYTDVGNTSAPLVYTMLSGTGYEGSKGMQGFELAAAENFITIGLTHYNATITKDSPNDGEVEWTPGTEDRMLVTVAERQANPEARFILFSLNIGAHSKLTEKGEDVVLACLNYLLGTAEGTIEPADCSFTFDNGENNEHDASWYASNCPSCTGTKGDGKWTTAANWGPDYRLLPGEFTSVRIKKPVEVNDEHAHVMEVRVIDEGSIDIPANKALDVKSTIRRMDGSEIYPTEENDIHVGSASTGNGTLIFNNDEGDTKARVDMYSKGFIDGEGLKNYQYIGTPFVEINALYNYYGSWIYSWGTKKNGNLGWVVVKNGGPMTAWTGYCITQEAPTYHQMSGTLTATGTVDITVPANANMVVGNSWTAPIDINALTTDDLEGLTANIYFFNTGVDKTGGGTTTENATGDARWTGGTYVSVPIHTAPYTGDDHIPSLQGFFVKSNGSAGTLHLDYDRHVRKTTRDNILSGQMHAPARRTALSSDEPVVLKMKVSGENYDDKLLLLEREDFTEGFDNGWDGDKWDGNESALYIYTTDNNGTENSVSAIPELEGTIIGFRAGEDDAYTLNFEYLNSDAPIYLYDTESNMYTQIMTGMTYRFFTTDNEKHERFIITRSNGQEVATGVESVSGSLDRSKAKKLLIEDKMFIMVNGMLYDATGKVVK